jgi:hypothetical protein
VNAKQRKRLETLLPGGWPRFVRVYDNDGATADRYTVVFNGRYRFLNENRMGQGREVMRVQVLHMSGAPFHPQGVCGHAEWPGFLDAPSGWTPQIGRKSTALPTLGPRITFAELPADCQKAALEDYISLWGLPEKEAWAAWEARQGHEGNNLAAEVDALLDRVAGPETLRTGPPEDSAVVIEAPAEEALVRAEGPEAEALVEAGVLAQSRGAETPESPNRLAFEEEVSRAAGEMPIRYGVRYYAGGTYTGEDWPEDGGLEAAQALGERWNEGAGDGPARAYGTVTNREAFVQRALGQQVFATEEEIDAAVSTGRGRIAAPSIEPPHAQYVSIMDRGDDGRLRPNQAHADLNPGDAEAAATFFRQGTETARLAPAGGAEEAERIRQARRAVEEWAGNRLGFPSNGIDPEFHWHAAGYCLALMDTGTTGFLDNHAGKPEVRYLLLGPQPEDIIAEGSDYFPSPMVDSTGRRAASDFVALFLSWDDGEHELTPRQKLFFAVEAGRVEDWASDLEEDEQAHTGETEEF